jgi:hypothetical protein
MEPKQDRTVMPWILANAYEEEPDALIALVRVCGGATRVTGGSTRNRRRLNLECSDRNGTKWNGKAWLLEI